MVDVLKSVVTKVADDVQPIVNPTKTLSASLSSKTKKIIYGVVAILAVVAIGIACHFA